MLSNGTDEREGTMPGIKDSSKIVTKNTSLMFKPSRSLLLEELHGMESKLAGSSISFSEVAITFTFYLVNITFTF